MAVVLAALRILGIALLVVLAVVLLMILLVLLVPFRYSFSGKVDDPEGSSEPVHLDLRQDLAFSADVRWLLGILHVSVSYDGTGKLQAKVFGFPLPLDKILHRKKKGQEDKPKAPSEPEAQKTLEERIEGVLVRIEKLHARICDALTVLGTDYGMRAKEKVLFRLLKMVESTLPAKWGLAGVLGLGDPARSAKVFAVQGYLYPVTAGHVAVGTDFDLYRYDLQGAAQGSIRLGTFVYAGIRLVLDGDVRRLIRRLRRGPGTHRNGNGHAFGSRASA